MSVKINHELDPIYETIILLYYGYDYEKFKTVIITQVTETGGNGEEFYEKYYKTFEKYFQTFQKNRIVSDRDSFYFKDTSIDFFSSFIALFLMKKDLINLVSQMDNDQIMRLILENSNEIFEQELSPYVKMTYEEIVKADNLTAFINHFELNENEKWKMLLILQNPKDYFNYFAELIKKNIPAFEAAAQIIKPSLDKLMEQFYKTFSMEEKALAFLEENKMSNCDIGEITPTMASAPSITITINSCYYGLLTEKTLAEFGYKNTGKEYLLTCLKALSDHSKFEILTSLKASPKYAAELATQLGLTSATVSHHMGTLMAAQLVYVEKENKKYYYHVDENSLSKILDQLRQLLL